MAIKRVGFVGLGIMGAPMAANLLKAGFSLTVWNRTPSRMEPLVELGALAADSPADVASASEVTLSCVTNSPDVEAIALGPRGVGEGAAPGSVYIDCSTIAPETARRVAAELSLRRVAMLDAPVSGGDVGAKAGTLAIMAGGEAEVFVRCLPVLEAIGKTIVHVGPAGSGQVVKLCNQVAGGLNLLAMAEAISLARGAGVDPAKMLEVVSAGAAGSWMLANLAPRAIRGDYAPGFMVDLMQKDLHLVLDEAARGHTPLPGTALVSQLFQVIQARGRGSDGTQSIVDAVARLAASEDR
ncbi:MAG: NAD(P)-dependent oxidoreductase [Chloroflexi bacterium]|nr:NAD(P)-dependent oxidoreductase [Dehalococcoidia bacterium]MCO5201570.1 NAD(P)-dependent oxidoreductase [Chloroflexota bacterium]MCZ7576770.1 NAD(P)-dependent oxidoreductase [Dehalococcoidia bacterium]NJD66239.1 NAD(P)-dependent oxidoreductase [Chloroflexota bacterium]PWB44411.1 MAG: 2-hydroxy-3-oxopropionate reductase [Dehalococcoidia bacterium]